MSAETGGIQRSSSAEFTSAGRSSDSARNPLKAQSLRHQTDFLHPDSAGRVQRSRTWSAHTIRPEVKPSLRYYAVGPSTLHIRCPLCGQRGDTEAVQLSGVLGHLSCLLSTLSCCFPIFSLSFVYLCLQNCLKSKRMFCNQCGGHLGFYRKPI